MTKSNKQNLLYSKYDDLSKIYDIASNKLIKTIPSPKYYYNSKKKSFEKIINKNDPIFIKNYSILGLNNNNNNNNKNKASLIKLKSKIIALHIPYIKLFKLYEDKN